MGDSVEKQTVFEASRAIAQTFGFDRTLKLDSIQLDPSELFALSLKLLINGEAFLVLKFCAKLRHTYDQAFYGVS